MTITPIHASGSTDGKPIVVAATSIGSGTAIHTAVSGTTSFDEITLLVTNTDSSVRTLTIGWGGTTDPDHLISKTVSIDALSGPIPVVVQCRLNNAAAVKAAADSASKLLITAIVNRYTP